jgi:hypothetical protein
MQLPQNEVSIDEIVHEANTRGYNVVQIDALRDDEKRIVCGCRGHSGPPNDQIVRRVDGPALLRLTAEIRRRAVVESSSSGGVHHVVVGPSYFKAGGDTAERPRPQNERGHFEAGGISVAYDVTLDSIGQESWTLNLGYDTNEDLERWTNDKLKICSEFASRLADDGRSDAQELLWANLDSAISLRDFNLDAWAAKHEIALLSDEEVSARQARYQEERRNAKIGDALGNERQQFVLFREWTKRKDVFLADDERRPDSFFAKSLYLDQPLRCALETNNRLQMRFICEREDGRVYEVTTLRWLSGSFVGRGMTDNLDDELTEISRALNEENE